jgi:NAD(P)-dependent dehydrogenase (short-subunit alcohol dehydrogenase family)
MSGALQGKVAIVTGGSSGIGEEAVLVFAREGARVVNADRQSPLPRAAEVEGDRVTYQACDVTREEDIRALIARVEHDFGGLDVLFNNAGASGAPAPIGSMEVADWDATMALVLRSGMLGMKHALPAMRRRGGGSIINTASVAGARAGIGSVAYSVAKAGVIQMTRLAALEFAADNIRVNAICPGVIPTPSFGDFFGVSRSDMTRVLPRVAEIYRDAQPLKRAGRPVDIAKMALFLASDAAAFITGQDFVVDGGMLLMPPGSMELERPGNVMDRTIQLALKLRTESK